jgi:hypothetical protein
MLRLHSKIIALTTRLGISYKDAAHRLYMAEIERLKMADSAARSFAMIKQRIDNMIENDIAPLVDHIDKWAFDDYVLKDGSWVKKSDS